MASLTKQTNNPGEKIKLYSSGLSPLKKNNIGIQLWEFLGDIIQAIKLV